MLSPQVEAVREEIYRMKQRDPAAKVLIFSQFTSMLDILHYRLTQVLVCCIAPLGHAASRMRLTLAADVCMHGCFCH